MTDQESVHKLQQAGKERAGAVEHLYRRYAKRFLGYFLRHRLSQHDAEELVKDVFVAVVHDSGLFTGERRFDAWMWAIARGKLADHFRRQRPEVLTDDDVLDSIGKEEIDSAPGRGSSLEDCAHKAYAVFAAAHPDRSEMLARVAFDGWSVEDLAEALKRTPGAAREYLFQCRRKLDVCLEPCREFLLPETLQSAHV